VSKSTHLIALNVLALALAVFLLFSGAALAQSQQSKVAVFGFGPNGSRLLDQPPASGTPVWVDTIAKTLIEGWTEYNPSTCTDISTGNYTVTTAPTHGKLFFNIENGTLANGDCPGVTFPFNVARYTWTDASQTVSSDPFTLDWTTPDGMFNDVNSWIGELAKIKQAKSVWWVCGVSGGSLPNTGTLTLTNPPLGATSFVWTITAGASDLVFSNGTATITTTAATAGTKALGASTAMNNVSMTVVVQKLTYLFKTDVRTPKQLKRRTSLDKDQGRGASCAVPGTLGWQSFIGYEVDDQFGVNSSTPDHANAGINEQFGAKTNHQSNDWRIPTEGGSPTPGGLFMDNMCITTTAFTPHPKPPQSPLSTDLVDQIAQTWYAGSSATPPPNKGCKVETDAFTRYIDHGRHLSIKSPPALGAGFAAQSSSARNEAGYPMPVPNVRYLAEQSATIVKGRVLGITEIGAVKEQAKSGVLTFHEKTASVRVDRVLKGNVENKLINVDFLENPDVLALSLEQNEYALLFLTSGQNGRYMFADLQVGKVPITSQNVPLDEAQTTAGKLEAELMASLSDPDSEVARTALEQVGNLGSVRSTQAIRNIASGGAPDFQGLAHRSLLRLGDYSLLDQAIRYAEEPVQELDAQRLQLGVVEAIGDIEDRSTVPALNSLLTSPSVNLRRAAAKALRAIGDPSSARFLVRALDDSDRDVQYDAVMALAGLAGATPDNAPARDVFDRNPANYLGKWKSWWETSGKQMYRLSH
jgi:hypothetical protein